MKISNTNKILCGGVVIAAIATLIRRVWLMELDSFEFDDAFMFIRYAENILAGNGYTWNADEPLVYGNTSILYTYIIALNKFIFGNLLSNSWILISAALVFAIGFLVKMQHGLIGLMKSKSLSKKLVVTCLTIPFLVFPLIFGFHISTGMETTLSLFLNASFVFAALQFSKREKSSFKFVLPVAIIGYLLFLTRPDNAIVVAFFPFSLLLFQKKWNHIVWFVSVMIIIIGIDSLVKYFAFGEILPLSFYAKKSGFTEGYTAKYFWNPIKYITQMVAYLMPFILLLFYLFKREKLGLIIAFLLPLILTFSYYFTFDQIMGFNARLYFPFIPYIIVPAFLLLDDATVKLEAKDLSEWNLNGILTKTVLLILFLFVMVFSKYRWINKYETYAINAGNKHAIAIEGLEKRKYNREQSIKIISDWLKEFPDDFVFGATEHGFIAGDNPKKKIVDFSGLHNTYIAKNGYDESVLKNNQPDFVWMPHQDLTVLHFEIRTGEYFKKEYEYIPDYFAFGCAIKKDSKYYQALKQKFQ